MKCSATKRGRSAKVYEAMSVAGCRGKFVFREWSDETVFVAGYLDMDVDQDSIVFPEWVTAGLGASASFSVSATRSHGGHRSTHVAAIVRGHSSSLVAFIEC